MYKRLLVFSFVLYMIVYYCLFVWVFVLKLTKQNVNICEN